MLIILSPAKTLDFNLDRRFTEETKALYTIEANDISDEIKKLNPTQLGKLMGINSKLAFLNYERFQAWAHQDTPEKQAILAYKGEVYNGLKANEWKKNDLIYSNEHIRILSGMYGMLRPLDMIKPYRLEMGTRISVGKASDLYVFWREKVTQALQDTIRISGHQILINLASREYSKVIDFEKLNIKVITPMFKEYRNGTYKFITVYGKNARGIMARWIIKNRIQDLAVLKTFDEDGYLFNHDLSDAQNWTYTR